MRLFVSYARVDRPFCEQIVRTLETAHEVWYDRRLHAGKRWWNEILKRLDWCEGFIYLLSPESVASEYCQNEYAIAVEQGKLVIPVRIQANTVIPPELLEIQVADFSEGLTANAVATLMAGITVAEREGLRPPAPARPPAEAPVIEESEISTTQSRFGQSGFPELPVYLDGREYVRLYATEPLSQRLVIRRGGEIGFIMLAWIWTMTPIATLVGELRRVKRLEPASFSLVREGAVPPGLNLGSSEAVRSKGGSSAPRSPHTAAIQTGRSCLAKGYS
jgi:hypothetical protein